MLQQQVPIENQHDHTEMRLENALYIYTPLNFSQLLIQYVTPDTYIHTCLLAIAVSIAIATSLTSFKSFSV